MSGINKIILVGNLGQDPTTKTFDDGNTVTNFSVATSRSWKDKNGEDKSETEWSKISCYGKLAEITSKYLTKGRQVYVEGRLRTRSYDKDGTTMYTTEVIAERVEFLGGGKETSETTTTATIQTAKTKTAPTRPNVKNYAPGATQTTTDDTGF